MNVNIAALRLCAAATNNIRVANVNMPEQNGGAVTIKRINNIVVNERLYDALVFSIPADICYLMEPQDWYKAYVHVGNEVIVQFPSLPYPDLNDPEAFIHGSRAARIDEPQVVMADQQLRHDVLNNGDRQWTTYCFTVAQNLDNRVVSPDQPNGRIVGRVIPEVRSGTTTVSDAKVQFMVAITN